MPARMHAPIMPCSGCGYNLIGLALDVPCPECNAPAVEAREQLLLGRVTAAPLRWLGFFLFLSGLVWLSRSTSLLVFTLDRMMLKAAWWDSTTSVFRIASMLIQAYGTPAAALITLFATLVLRRAGHLSLPRLIAISVCALVVLGYHAALMLGVPAFPRVPRTPGDPLVLLWVSMRYAHNVPLLLGATLVMYQAALAVRSTRLAYLILPLGLIWTLAEWQSVSSTIAFLWGRPTINVAAMLPQHLAALLNTSARHTQWCAGFAMVALTLILAVRVRRVAAKRLSLERL